MGLFKLSGLYCEVILDYGDYLYYKNVLLNVIYVIMLKNLICGDVINLVI